MESSEHSVIITNYVRKRAQTRVKKGNARGYCTQCQLDEILAITSGSFNTNKKKLQVRQTIDGYLLCSGCRTMNSPETSERVEASSQRCAGKSFQSKGGQHLRSLFEKTGYAYHNHNATKPPIARIDPNDPERCHAITCSDKFIPGQQCQNCAYVFKLLQAWKPAEKEVYKSSWAASLLMIEHLEAKLAEKEREGVVKVTTGRNQHPEEKYLWDDLFEARNEAVSLDKGSTRGMRWEKHPQIINFAMDLIFTGGRKCYELLRGDPQGGKCGPETLQHYNIVLPSYDTVMKFMPRIDFTEGICKKQIEEFGKVLSNTRNPMEIAGNYRPKVLLAFDEVHCRQGYYIRENISTGSMQVLGTSNEIKDVGDIREEDLTLENMASQLMVFILVSSDGRLVQEVGLVQTQSMNESTLTRHINTINEEVSANMMELISVTGDGASVNVSCFQKMELSCQSLVCIPDYVHVFKNLRNQLLPGRSGEYKAVKIKAKDGSVKVCHRTFG